MRNVRDFAGKQINRWFVIRKLDERGAHGEVYWLCQCQCGTKRKVLSNTLALGTSKSCGCYSVDKGYKHGMEGTPTYNCWAHMLTRCNNSNHKQYDRYGGRGIKVCKSWHTFTNFYADMGEKPDGLSLDRIDNDGGYNKKNCRWATKRQQVGNQSRSLRFEWNGKLRTLSDLAHEHGMNRRRVYQRLLAGWTLADALKTKVRGVEK